MKIKKFVVTVRGQNASNYIVSALLLREYVRVVLVKDALIVLNLKLFAKKLEIQF